MVGTNVEHSHRSPHPPHGTPTSWGNCSHTGICTVGAMCELQHAEIVCGDRMASLLTALDRGTFSGQLDPAPGGLKMQALCSPPPSKAPRSWLQHQVICLPCQCRAPQRCTAQPCQIGQSSLRPALLMDTAETLDGDE